MKTHIYLVNSYFSISTCLMYPFGIIIEQHHLSNAFPRSMREEQRRVEGEGEGEESRGDKRELASYALRSTLL